MSIAVVSADCDGNGITSRFQYDLVMILVSGVTMFLFYSTNAYIGKRKHRQTSLKLQTLLRYVAVRQACRLSLSALAVVGLEYCCFFRASFLHSLPSHSCHPNEVSPPKKIL